MLEILPWMDCQKHNNKNEIADLFTFNLFVCNAPFLYPLKISENLKVFWCFQGVEKWCIGNKWVNKEIFKGQLFYPREYTGLLKTSKTGSFITIVNGLKLLTIVAKLSIWDICRGPGYASIEKSFLSSRFEIKREGFLWIQKRKWMHVENLPYKHSLGCSIFII